MLLKAAQVAARRSCRAPVLRSRGMAVAALHSSDLSGFREKIQKCNTGVGLKDQFLPFNIAGRTVGYIADGSFLKRLLYFNQVFKLAHAGDVDAVVLADGLDDCDSRTTAVAGVLAQLEKEGLIPGWRGELYPVVNAFHEEPVMLIERAASALFGMKAYGIHVNGYVRDPEQGLLLWVARRSKSKPTWPGKLDHIVAGGQPHGLSCRENVLKECAEEAGIPLELASKAVPVGAVSYQTLYEAGLKRDVLFCYDLELPASFQPAPSDGEVEEFMLWPLEKVAEVVRDTTEYKDNCTLVIIDFLVRHGHLAPEQAGYAELVASLRAGDCS